MRKHDTKDNIISALLGAVIAVPICFMAWESWSEDPKPETIERSLPTYSETLPAVGVETAFQIDENEVEEWIDGGYNNRELLGDFTVTAYCPCKKCCGEWADGLTYTETKATEGRTLAVDPEVISLGSVVEVNGVNYVAEDIGGAVNGKHVEIYFSDHNEALEWGRQSLPVYMVEECLGEF